MKYSLDEILGCPCAKNWVRSGNFRIVECLMNIFWCNLHRTIADHYLVVQRWILAFIESAKKIKKIAVWVHFPRLPMELYHETILGRVGPLLGTILKIDKLTLIHTQGKFARICVEIDLQKSLVPKIEAKRHVYCVEYEGLHLICFKCDKYGHKVPQCGESVV
ncbi:hypothetical protein CR513_23871, partial [Mucuna pruriens]